SMLFAPALPGRRRGGNAGLVVVEQAQRKEALLQVEPDALDGVELGRVRRQRHEGDARWHTEGLAAVPPRAVQHQRDVLVIGNGLCERIEKRPHSRAVRIRQDQREGIVGAGLDGGVDVGGYIALIKEARRSLAALPPDMTDATLLPDARLVLEIQAKPLVFMRTLYFSHRSQGSF